MALKKSQKSLKRWTKQKWRTASGKKSSETGEVYAPAATIKKLKSTAAGRKKLAAANKKKRAATKKGKQHARLDYKKNEKNIKTKDPRLKEQVLVVITNQKPNHPKSHI